MRLADCRYFNHAVFPGIVRWMAEWQFAYGRSALLAWFAGSDSALYRPPSPVRTGGSSGDGPVWKIGQQISVRHSAVSALSWRPTG